MAVRWRNSLHHCQQARTDRPLKKKGVTKQKNRPCSATHYTILHYTTLQHTHSHSHSPPSSPTSKQSSKQAYTPSSCNAFFFPLPWTTTAVLVNRLPIYDSTNRRYAYYRLLTRTRQRTRHVTSRHVTSRHTLPITLPFFDIWQQ